MSQITLFFQPPLYWQQFEDLAEAMFPYRYGERNPTKVGRPGQSQNGVDVYGRCDRTGQWVGIQCKRLDELDQNNNVLPGGPITRAILQDEYTKALDFRPHLGSWILATTAKRDATIQTVARQLDDESVGKGMFRVYLWFWDDFVSDLNRHYELQSQYYSEVLHFRGAREQDIVLLELFAEAFSRPAFQVPLTSESPDDFIQALKDTQRVINTGELVDRETRHVIKRGVGGSRCLTDRRWRQSMASIYSNLRELRTGVQEGLANGRIRISQWHLDIDSPLSEHLSKLRSDATDSLNKVLIEAGLSPVL